MQYIYINLRRSRDGTDGRTELRTELLTVHVNALYNESVHGREEHAT